MDPLLDKIANAFEGVHPPRKITLSVATAHDDYDYKNDDSHRENDFLGSWQELPESHLLDGVWGLAHLDRDGIHYYIPAAMTWVLRNYKTSDSMLVDWTIYQLVPDRDSPELSSRFDQRFSLFSANQRSVCREFLEELLTADPDGHYIDSTAAEEALTSEWRKHREG